MTYKEAVARFKGLRPTFDDDYKDLLKFYEKSLEKNAPHNKIAFTTLMSAYKETKVLTRPGEL